MVFKIQEKPKPKPKPKRRALSAEVEFPKMLFKDNGDTMVVENVHGLESALEDGWKERTK